MGTKKEKEKKRNISLQYSSEIIVLNDRRHCIWRPIPEWYPTGCLIVNLSHSFDKPILKRHDTGCCEAISKIQRRRKKEKANQKGWWK